MTFARSSGVLLHPTSFPGRYGIGDLGQEAYRFIDFLVGAGQSLWQVLPLGPTGYGDSPYQCFSAFAGNPLLIDPEQLMADGLLAAEDLADVPPFPAERVDYGWVINWKIPLLKRSFNNFRSNASTELRAGFEAFCAQQAAWLDDYALFMALKDIHNGRPWGEWELDIRTRQPEALARWQAELAEPIQVHRYLQWLFYRQWLALKAYANQSGIRIIGDIPIFVAYDSADVWANPDLFYLDETGQPTVVAGVPPDYFSETGQLWGNPLYRWDEMARRGYRWWIERFRATLTLVDIVRIDHFRGFYNYWEIPFGEETAVNGRWVMGPGAELFQAVIAELGSPSSAFVAGLPIIAEDLGDFTPEARAGVDALMEEFGFPGMKVLQFGFGSDASDPFLPHNFTSSNWVVYPGTHDNDTIVGWFHESSTPREREYALKYLGKSDGSTIAWDFIRLAWASVARIAIASLQDLLGLGSWARMNVPSRASGNWQWRYRAGDLTDELRERLLELTAIYGRLPQDRDSMGKQVGKE